MIWEAVDRRRLMNHREYSGFDNIEVASGGALLHYTHLCRYFHLQTNHQAQSAQQEREQIMVFRDSKIKNQESSSSQDTCSVELVPRTLHPQEAPTPLVQLH